MQISAATLDDLLHGVFKRALSSSIRTRSSKGDALELIGVMLTLDNPCARFSRTDRRAALFSCLGETIWYLSGSNKLDAIEYYIPRYRKFIDASRHAVIARGAYGPRIFGRRKGGASQFDAVVELLRTKRDTRQAVIQVFSAGDTRYNDVPCTCTLQFFSRSGKLHMMTHMRSNDAYRGLPHDIFAFTFIQEMVARRLSLKLGAYHHAVGSLHLYEDDVPQARQFLREGWQSNIAMPRMPLGDPDRAVRWLIQKEAEIRLGTSSGGRPSSVDPYWQDLARLLRIKAMILVNDKRGIVKQKQAMFSPVYDEYIRTQVKTVSGDASPSEPTLL